MNKPRSLRERNEAMIKLLDEWLADESGYDEATWPKLEKSIELNRTSCRKRFTLKLARSPGSR